jgi:N-acetylglucosaminyl-diphospho-decaprenol L-rhamnosyltransferase
VTTAVVTIVRGRHDHLARQQQWLARGRALPERVLIVSMGDPDLSDVVAEGPLKSRTDVLLLDDNVPLALAAARNAGARAAWAGGAALCVFLDVDCLPGPGLLGAYEAAHRSSTEPAVLCGPVAYLPQPGPGGYAGCDVESATPHPARPAPRPGATIRDDRWELFWSLSFALGRRSWDCVGGFDEAYVGYGGEDTDFGQRARAAGAHLYWVGGARAGHQWHPKSDPPVEHLHDIVANANRFYARWGWFPMTGWLEEFHRRGLVTLEKDASAWTVARTEADGQTAARRGL